MNEACFYRVSVKALIVDELGKFLLAKESDDTWDFLGGGLEHGKDPVAELEREITEEAGLTVTGISPSPKYFVTAKKPSIDVFMANVFYEVTVRDLNFRPSDECEELRYFSAAEARKENILPNVEKFLDVYEPGLNS